MSRWWRAYDEAANDPKLQRLDGESFKAWFNLMCLSSMNGGVLPSIDDVAFTLRMTKDKAAAMLAKLVTKGLFDRRDDGAFEPHNWSARQYKSDKDPTNAERQRRFKAKKRTEDNSGDNATDNGQGNGSGNGQVTGAVTQPEQSRAEQITGAALTAQGAEVGEKAAGLTAKLLSDLQILPSNRLSNGAGSFVQGWLDAGFSPAAIEMGVLGLREIVQGTDPPYSFAFFRRAVQRAQRSLNVKTELPESQNDERKQGGGNTRGRRRSTGDTVNTGLRALAEDFLGKPASSGGEAGEIPPGRVEIDG